MNVNLINIDPTKAVPISYGLDITLSTSTIAYRTKVGVEIVIDGVYRADAEADAYEADVDYEVGIGKVILRSISKPTPRVTFVKEVLIVDDGFAHVTLRPYTISKDEFGVWGLKVYDPASDVSFVAVRGVSREAYKYGHMTPKLGEGSVIFEPTDPSNPDKIVNKTMSWQQNSLKSLYYQVVKHSGHTNQQVTVNFIDHYADGSTHEIFYSKPMYDIENNYLELVIGNIAEGLTHKTLEIVETATVSGSTVTLMTTNLTVNFECNMDYDFSFDLLFLDTSFMWATIPFTMKNTAGITRDSQELEEYDGTKRKWNIKPRMKFQAKTDYMDKDRMNAVADYALATEFFILMTGSSDIQRAFIQADIIPYRSSTNEPLSQIELTVEVAKPLPKV
jgi:hypothetical protein